ncbi:MAG: hypothetical protein HYR75_04695 [Gemmatimonadetes bacterium]|nr:hypothetical protein [Gemmatimonadota bacterium]MBI3566654.1 hypothetical protein [Gemmatimonadota bacterium]
MTFRPRTILFALCFATSPLAAQGSTPPAQVGALPDQSPFRDLEDGQRFGLVAGIWSFGHDPVNVGPNGTSPAFGLRYDLYLGGPAYFSVQALSGSVVRNVIDYLKHPASRLVGTQSSVLTDVNAGLTIALTGARSWHHVQPLVNFGLGMMFDAGDSQGDVSGFAVKPALSLNTGMGVRWITSKNSELRADLALAFWQLKYPQNYRSTDADPQAVYPTGSLSPWTVNKTVTLGWTWRVFK